MSDVFEGPGWWMASDGKWYPPNRHPDENYRNRFLTPEPGSSTLPQISSEQADEQADEPADEADAPAEQGDTFPTIGLHTETTIIQPDSDVARAAELETAEISSAQLQAQLAEVERQRVAEAARRLLEAESEATAPPKKVDVSPPPSFSISTPSSPPSTERPIFDDTRPASVVAAPPREPLRQHVGRSQLEVDKLPEAPPKVSSAGPLGPSSVTASISAEGSSTALVHVAGGEHGVATSRDRIIAALIFSSGIALIVGTFLDWTTGSVVQTGWDRGDGIATVAAGVIGSAMAGPIFVGFRHMIPKSVAIIAGLLGIVVVGLAAITGVLDSSTAGISLGPGFYVVFVGSALMAAAAIADQGDVLD